MKTAIVTGANGAVGRAIAEGIAIEGSFRVVMVGRNPHQIEETARFVIRITSNRQVEAAVVDLSSMASIQSFANHFSDAVHILVNNAATAPQQRLESDEGIEMQWAVNVLGYFRMIQAFTPHLTRAGAARVVNVASYYAGGLDLSDPEFKIRRYDNDIAYRQSKQANRMMTKAFADMMEGMNVMVNACHPGDVNSKLSNNLGFGGHETPIQGADTPVWLATSKDAEGITGKYFEQRRQQYCNFMADTTGVKHLLRAIETIYSKKM